MKHASTRMIFSYWDALRGERAAPDRGEIEPGEIRHVLADTFILEIGADRTAEFRLAGTRLCALFGRELKGARFVDLWPEHAGPGIRRHVGTVIDETAGLVIGLLGTTESGDTVDLEMVLLPLRHRGKPHARVLGALSPATIPAWLGFSPVTSLATVSLRVIWPSGRSEGPSFGRGDPQDRRRRFVVHEGGRSVAGD
ncbi:PAS domain-containing protein [Salinarimonas soli]|uniref:PAS domain-containing protein n=1 Tax=Salinarimonas soli TaxID=1638099 RepID=A0A5B2VVG9_9HYPH|nr:PAS domain-containing protein [Salinarimonas soli]KAA2242196.1 PAS domain-containing protein [Salinarimonas soli]